MNLDAISSYAELNYPSVNMSDHTGHMGNGLYGEFHPDGDVNLPEIEMIYHTGHTGTANQ